jgi:hypothetical protein
VPFSVVLPPYILLLLHKLPVRSLGGGRADPIQLIWDLLHGVDDIGVLVLDHGHDILGLLVLPELDCPLEFQPRMPLSLHPLLSRQGHLLDVLRPALDLLRRLCHPLRQRLPG